MVDINTTFIFDFNIYVSVQIGLICALSAILPLYMDALNYTFQETAAILSMFLFSGISGVIILAPATDHLQNHWENSPKHLLILLAAIGVAGAFSLITNSMENNFSAIAISVCMIGVSITSGIPLALEEGASINPSKAGFSASIMISAGNLLGYGTVYLTEFLKANENYNKAGYIFLALLSIQFIANLFIESKRSSKFDDDDSDYEQYNDDEETKLIMLMLMESMMYKIQLCTMRKKNKICKMVIIIYMHTRSYDFYDS